MSLWSFFYPHEIEMLKKENAALRKQILHLMGAQMIAPPDHSEAVGDIIHRIGALYGFSAGEMVGPRRHKPLVIARHHAIWEVRKNLTWLSLPQIGRAFGNRDHTTIIHACRQHEKRMAEIPQGRVRQEDGLTLEAERSSSSNSPVSMGVTG